MNERRFKMQYASDKLKPIGSIASFRGRKMPKAVFNSAMTESGLDIKSKEPPIWDTIRISLSQSVNWFYIPGHPKLVVEELRNYRKNGFIVTGVKREAGSVERTPVIKVKPEDNGTGQKYALTFESGMPSGPIGSDADAFRQRLKEKFKTYFETNYSQQTITGTSVGKLLREVVNKLGAYEMGGQNFWLPPAPSVIWAKVSKELRHDLTIRCFKLDSTSPETLASIRDAVMEDIEKRAAEIKEDIASGNLSKNALEVRKERALALQQEITKLEAHFGETLDFVRSKANVANQGLASSQSMMDDDDIFKVDL